MKLLDVSDSIVVRATPRDVCVVRAMMLSPDNPVLRAQIENAYVIDIGVALANQGRLSEGANIALLNSAARAPRVSDLAKESDKRYQIGLRTGRLLYTSVGRSMAGQAASLASVRAEIRPRSQNSKTLNQEWTKFRCVAHLWAAHWFYRERGHLEFPFGIGKAGLFLAIAESYREIAEKTRSAQRATSILASGESVSLPSSVKAQLPAGSVRV